MRLLLDSHVLLWSLGAEPRLSERSHRQIATDADEAFVSAASLWELTIKRSIGRLRVDADLVEFIARSGFRELQVSFEHAMAVSELPPHHRDPFDRLLVAQAQVEGLTLATGDAELALYDVPVLEVTHG